MVCYRRVHDSKGKKINDGNHNKGCPILEVGEQVGSFGEEQSEWELD